MYTAWQSLEELPVLERGSRSVDTLLFFPSDATNLSSTPGSTDPYLTSIYSRSSRPSTNTRNKSTTSQVSRNKALIIVSSSCQHHGPHDPPPRHLAKRTHPLPLRRTRHTLRPEDPYSRIHPIPTIPPIRSRQQNRQSSLRIRHRTTCAALQIRCNMSIHPRQIRQRQYLSSS